MESLTSGWIWWDVQPWEDCSSELTHLNTPEQQTAKTSSFLKVLTPTSDTWVQLSILIPVEAIRVCSVYTGL